jgi:acetyltransferase-like isoleucine patch superfamily enzyme
MKKESYIIVGKKCKIASSARIMYGAVIGKKFRKLLTGDYDKKDHPTKIGDNVYVGYYSLVGNGTTIEKGSVIDDKSIIESGVTIGTNSLTIYGAQLCNDVEVGNSCVIGGLIGERTKIGHDCRVFGNIVHSQSDPMNPWDEDSSEEKYVTVKDKVFIGFNAVVAGEIVIGPKAYILAGSIITEDVPPEHIAFGRNQFLHYTKWKGQLKGSNLFR